MRPPVTLCEFDVLETWSRRCAAATRCVPTPLTRTRRKVRLMGLPSTSSRVVVPNFVVGLAALTNASASMTATAFATHGAGSPTQLPAAQASPLVQALPSLHAVPLATGGFEQVPAAGSQVPAVWHWSRAVHTTAVPAHVPARQLSPVVHALASEHAVPSAMSGFEQAPVTRSQVPAVWHWSSAAQSTAVPVQAPA